VLENIIFYNLSLPELGACSRVCKAWKELAKKHISAFSYEKAFGPKEWLIYFRARLRNIPRLPLNIAEIMNSPCPFWPNKKVYETHLLVLVPQTIRGQPITLRTVEELVKNPLEGYATQYSYFDLGEHTDPDAPPSHWVLMTRDVIKGSRNTSYKDQQTLIQERCQEKQVLYEVPHILDATVCILMEFVRSGSQLYSKSPCTYTRCQEPYDANLQLIVGGFGPDGLNISCCSKDYETRGVGGCRKFETIKH
jgi:hypothetical protein